MKKAILFALLIAAAIAPSAAADPLPTCESIGQTVNVTPDAGDEAAYGRTVDLSASGRGDVIGTVMVSVAPLVPGDESPTLPATPITYAQPPQIRFSEGDGTAMVTYAWTQQDYDEVRCTALITQVINPVKGTKPVVGRGKDHDKHYDGTLGLWIRLPRDCATAAPGQISFTITSRGRRRTAVLGDQCSGWAHRPKTQPKGWVFKALNEDDEDAASLFFYPTERRRTYTQYFDYRVRWSGKTVAKGRARARVYYDRGYRIYDSDFDNFINQCINGNRQTWASGGRLYCWIPPTLGRTMKFL